MKSAKFSVVKTAALKAKVKASAAVPGPVVDFQIGDNEDASFTLFGVDKAGNGGIDISSLATLEVASDNPSILTVDPPQGMTSAMHAVGPIGSANIACDVTWNDGSIGPFGCDIAVTTKAGPVTGVVPVIGPVTPH